MRLIALVSMDYTVQDQKVELRIGKAITVDDQIAGILVDRGYAEKDSGAAAPTPAPAAIEEVDDEPAEPEAPDGGDAELEAAEEDEVDLDEILSATVVELAADIAAGDHDGYLTELEDAEGARSRPRKGVFDAIDERRAALS